MPSVWKRQILAVGFTLLLLAPYASGQDAAREALLERWNQRLTGSLLVTVQQAPNRTPDVCIDTWTWQADHPPFIGALDLSSRTLDVFAGPLVTSNTTERVGLQWGASSRQVYLDAPTGVVRGVFVLDRDRGDSRPLLRGLNGFTDTSAFTATPLTFGFDPVRDVLYVAVNFETFPSPWDSTWMTREIPDWAEASLLCSRADGRNKWTDLLAVDTTGAVTFVTRLLDLDIAWYGAFEIAGARTLVAHRGHPWIRYRDQEFFPESKPVHVPPPIGNPLSPYFSRIEILDCLSGQQKIPRTGLPGIRFDRVKFSRDGSALAAVGLKSGRTYVYLSRGPCFSHFRKLAELESADPRGLNQFCWSPDGQWLLFSGCRPGRSSVCDVIALEVATRATITLDEFDPFGPDWDSSYYLKSVHDWIE